MPPRLRHRIDLLRVTTTGWPCQGEVILRLPAAEVVPVARDGIVEALGSRRCRVILDSWSWTGLAAVIGRFDTDIEVIGPPRLATAFGDLAARYAHAATRSRVRRLDFHMSALVPDVREAAW